MELHSCCDRVIVTTTINAPTEAIRKYDRMEKWKLIVVGDERSPEYKLERGRFISWEEQQELYPDLCRLIGANSVARGRMIAFIEGYKTGAEIIASIDDDNEPYEYWGKDIELNKPISVVCYYNEDVLVFNPLSVISSTLFHRGFPLEFRGDRVYWKMKEIIIKPLVREDLWTGDPDIDAIDRILYRPHISYHNFRPFTTTVFSPVNTQNTFIHRSAIKYFPANLPFIGRVDDIWASYLFQAKFPLAIVYYPASVHHYQKRTYKSLVDDLEKEVFGYRNTGEFLKILRTCIQVDTENAREIAIENFLEPKLQEAIQLYESYFQD